MVGGDHLVAPVAELHVRRVRRALPLGSRPCCRQYHAAQVGIKQNRKPPSACAAGGSQQLCSLVSLGPSSPLLKSGP